MRLQPGREIRLAIESPAVSRVWKFSPQIGTFWPAGDAERAWPMAVLGPRLRRDYGAGRWYTVAEIVDQEVEIW